MKKLKNNNILQCAKEVLAVEAAALGSLEKRLDKQFSKAVNIIAASQGRIVVTGMGKAGI